MRYRLANSHFQRLARLVMVVLLATSTTISWASPILGSHCDSHTRAAHSSSAPVEHDSGPLATPSWTQGSNHDCPHCPPSDCSRLAPCATSGSVAAAEPSTPIADLPPHSVTPTTYNRQHPSTLVQPPTPPPQLVA